MKKSVAVNTVFNVSYKLLNILFPLVTSVYLSRILGAAYLGKVGYAQSILSYFVVFASLGIPTYGMREIARAGNDKALRDKVFSELFIINLTSSLISTVLYLIVVFGIDSLRADIYLYMCVGLTLFMNVFNIDWFYAGQEEYVYITVRSFIIKLISIIAILVIIKEQSDYRIYALITSLATTGNYVLNVINLRKKVKFCFHGIALKKHLQPVFILVMTMLATDLYNQVDVTMLGIFRTEEEVGFYSNGIRLARIVYSVTTAISATSLPRMCYYFKNNKSEEFKGLFWNIFRYVMLFSLPAAVGIALVSNKLVVLLFGEEFYPTGKIVQLLAIIIAIISFSYLIGSVVLTATENEKYLLKATVVGAVTNFVLNAFLIPNFGTTGAVIASITGESAVFGVHLYYGWKYVKSKLDYKFIASVLISVLGMAVVVKLVYRFEFSNLVSVLLSAGSGILAYYIMLKLTRNNVLLALEKMVIKKLKRRKKRLIC